MEKKNLFFESEENMESSRFPTVLSLEERGCISRPPPPLRAHQGDISVFSLISMHHNGFTKSFACCLSCESCLCAQCQMPGQEGGDIGRVRCVSVCGVGRRVEGGLGVLGAHPRQPGPDPEASLYSLKLQTPPR